MCKPEQHSWCQMEAPSVYGKQLSLQFGHPKAERCLPGPWHFQAPNASTKKFELWMCGRVWSYTDHLARIGKDASNA